MKTLAFIGAGRMATAIVQGLLQRKLYPPTDLYCCSGDDDTGKTLSQLTGIHYCEKPTDFPPETDLILLACKLQQLDDLDPNIPKLAAGKTLLSILAGTPIAKLRNHFPDSRQIIRTMPNTPGSIGAGVTAYTPEEELSDSDTQSIESILGTLGHILLVPEEQIDAITAISGSGPAYFFQFTNTLAEAATQLGLSPEQAQLLATQTFIGSAKLLEQSQQTPTQLRNAVTSPGGTTQAALESFQRDHLTQIVANAANAARDRSIELSQ